MKLNGFARHLVVLLGVVCFVYATQARADQARPTILILGDSLSAAYKLSAEDGWGHLLVQRLAAQGFNYEVVNASISGATTNAGLQRMPALLEKHKPEYVLLELGANDGLQGMPVAGITRNLESLIKQALHAGAEVILLGIQLPPNFGSRYTQPFFEQYSSLAKKYNLALVPFLLEGVAGKPALMQADGLHPTAEAQPIVLNNVWPVLKEQLSKK
ncbi:arylesterase [Saccharophagus degradans]|uniref:Arylesterase n=1 Tax=Saccharophagus degradans (strain 2-40 / ATCC 43961 / DSM 17024) TaxID=203122 RepID=Q21F30_SACD2|nr:arylesterase [Saccharophagus degradans]ABD82699.1 Arylesterase [Saccharophagus degradans 2-40]